MRYLLPLVAVFTVLLQPALADAPAGAVTGTVRDPGGNPVPGAFLSLSVNEQINVHYWADARGHYSIPVAANWVVGPLCAIAGSAGTVVPGGQACVGNGGFTVAPGATLVLDIVLTPIAATPTPTPQPSSGGPAAATPSPAAPASPAPAATPRSVSSPCRFVLGFEALHDLIPQTVGTCLDDEWHDPQSGDGLQHTTRGLLVWRKADNHTAFTDGYRTWVNGPQGIQKRLNSQRFAWEANPDGLPVVP